MEIIVTHKMQNYSVAKLLRAFGRVNFHGVCMSECKIVNMFYGRSGAGG